MFTIENPPTPIEFLIFKGREGDVIIVNIRHFVGMRGDTVFTTGNSFNAEKGTGARLAKAMQTKPVPCSSISTIGNLDDL